MSAPASRRLDPASPRGTVRGLVEAFYAPPGTLASGTLGIRMAVARALVRVWDRRDKNKSKKGGLHA